MSTNLLDLMQRRYGLAVDASFAERFVVRAEVGIEREHYSYEGPNSSYDVFGLESEGEYVYWYNGGHHVALSLLAFLERTHRGAFVEGGVRDRTFSDRLYDQPNTDHWSGLAPRLMIGWQQPLDFGFTVTAALGGQYEWLSADFGGAEQHASFSSYLRVGVAF